jgi:formate-nitrite transporter family protein
MDLERDFGRLRSAEDLPAVIRAWRRRIPGASCLSEPVDAHRDHVRGDPAAPVVVVEYGDYQCSECAEAHELWPRIQPWIEDGRLCGVFRHFPLLDAHPLALRAAQAAEAAAAQGRFWPMHDTLMRHEIVTDDDRQEHLVLLTPHTPRALERAAHHAALDLARFWADIDSPGALEHILDDFRSGLASGVNGTPTFYLNNERVDLSGIDDLYALIGECVAVHLT